MQRRQIIVGIERRGHLALRDRMIASAQHVLLARPQQLDRRARHLLGDIDGLPDIVGLAAAPETADFASPHVWPTYAGPDSRPSASHFAIDALVTLAFSPSSQTIGKASSAVLACHQVSATTATALSPTFTTFLTPFMPAILVSS